jgi:ribosomal protein S18 acetylase RimI-like enzyme
MTLFQVRQAVPEDVPELAGIFRRAALSNHGDRAQLLMRPELLLLPEDLLTARDTVVATLSDGTRVGFASTRSTAPTVLELEDLFVEPSWKRRGVARALMQDIVARSATGNATRIEVTANSHALPFYRAVGFEDDGEVETELRTAPRMRLVLTGS